MKLNITGLRDPADEPSRVLPFCLPKKNIDSVSISSFSVTTLPPEEVVVVVAALVVVALVVVALVVVALVVVTFAAKAVVTDACSVSSGGM